MWLVPIVIGWLWTPACSHDKLKAAIDKANDLAFVAAPDSMIPQIDGSPDTEPPRRAYDVSDMQGIRIYKRKKVFTLDAARAAPVFNYARIWEWSSTVETIARAFEHADRKARRRVAVNNGKEWVSPEEKLPRNHRENRTGTIGQVQAYCGFPVGDEKLIAPVPSGVWKRIVVASVFALGLQWATTVSAAMTVIFTPAIGLGCRSGAYILYGIVSTMIWAALLLSSYLAHYAKVRHDRGDAPRGGFSSVKFAKGLATFLRRLSTFAACCNTIGIILVCVFQFSNFFSRCYCNSSVLGRGSRNAFTIIDTSRDNGLMRGGWIGGVVLAGGFVFAFLGFLHLMLEPSRDTINN